MKARKPRPWWVTAWLMLVVGGPVAACVGLPALVVAGAIINPAKPESDEDRRLREAREARSAEAHRQQDAQRDADAAAAAEVIETCGKGPIINPWTGGLPAGEAELARTANDPDSISSAECTSPVLTDKCWKTTCIVRGKNGFGALIANTYTFYVGKDDAILAYEQVK